ncbi:centromere protein L [Megalops cyprinoides]|uniref:centromere protein L n=1 Tax=Megalops cyprinoides TaxID=118141 RepID=UPI0018648C14|nr:centromere protein L [Megalops cyprinoides]
MHDGKARCSNSFPVSLGCCVLAMEGRESATMTPQNQTTRHRRSKSYGRSRRSLGVDLTTQFGCTPGQLTTVRIPTSREIPKPRPVTEQLDPEQIALLVKKEWKLSYVTPLYQFRHTMLKTYAKQLAAFIVAEKQQGVAVEVGPETGFKVVFSTVLGLAETKEDAETVFIQIHSKSAFATEGEAAKLVWSGWLTCVCGDPEYLRSLPDGFVCLPLFCAGGAESLTAVVKSWFERTFDCCFGPLAIGSTSLRWLAALWTACHPNTSIRYLKLEWKIPAEPPLDILYSVRPQDAWELWDSIRQEGGARDSVDIEEVDRFTQGLEAHFFRHFRIYLSAGTLTKVSTALGSAHHEGKVRITCSDNITSVLTLLTECALLKMPI